MESSRDSSIWRSLAIAFADGLAFGVGVKLTQGAARRAGAPPQPDFSPITGRIAQMEQRVERIEHTPAAVAAAPGFDQKVLEAVVNALDARLHEQAGQVEGRLREFEAQIAIELQSIHHQDDAIASSIEQQVAAALEGQLRPLESLVATAVDATIEDRLALLRAEAAERNREIADLRERLAENDRNVLDLILAIGQMCRQAAERIPVPGAPQAEPDAPAPEVSEEPAAASAPAPVEMGSTEAKPPARLWRVPLVSSFLLAAGGLLLLHYR
jgi:hypothetical protein